MSTLIQLRTEFVLTTGRYDLVVDTSGFVDAGADVYLQRAIKLLDRRRNFQKSDATIPFVLSTGINILALVGYRAILRVYVTTSDARYFLERASEDWLLQLYDGVTDFDDVPDGDPLYYAIRKKRVATYTVGADVDDELLILPAPDENITVTVIGRFSAPALAIDGDENYWSVEWPEVVITAARFLLENDYRNTQGMSDATAFIDQLLFEIDADQVEEEIAGIDQQSPQWPTTGENFWSRNIF